MAYEIRIEKTAPNSQISPEEWQKVVREDQNLEFVAAQITSPTGELICYENPLLVQWQGHIPPVWFDYRRGQICTKNPDEATLQKMKAIAALLDANVVGDEGECY